MGSSEVLAALERDMTGLTSAEENRLVLPMDGGGTKGLPKLQALTYHLGSFSGRQPDVTI